MSKSLPAVITTLERAGGFASAQEVFQLMRKQGKPTGLATVYRALQKAATENTVDVIRKDDGVEDATEVKDDESETTGEE